MSKTTHHQKPDLRNAPAVFRERLENLRKRGILDDPKFLEAFKAAMEEVAEEQRGPLGPIAKERAATN